MLRDMMGFCSLDLGCLEASLGSKPPYFFFTSHAVVKGMYLRGKGGTPPWRKSIMCLSLGSQSSLFSLHQS